MGFYLREGGLYRYESGMVDALMKITEDPVVFG